MNLIKTILQNIIDKIDAGNSNLSYEQQCKVIRILSNIDDGTDNEMSKTQAAEYIGVCRATFDNYVRDGFIPKGRKVDGFKELRWYKSDLDVYLVEQ